ncbi:MAG: FlgD immunoglobulin-like domain containing protein, partial [Candidatus Eisenbacteria bacterium]|nr:FlgD immunoglobulin-like domain containing protein [Candidatus Eisenbacteria bacterium]
GSASGVAVSANYAYVGDRGYGFHVIDISNPASPTIVGSVHTPASDGWNVALSGNYAYVADGGPGLRVVDISNPASPTIVGSAYTGSNGAWDVAVSGNYAYVASGFSGLHVVDISNPLSPNVVGIVATPFAADGVALSGSYAYVADRDYGPQVIYISNPSSPIIVGSVDTPGWALGVAISGEYAYVADYSSGLQVVPTQCEIPTQTDPPKPEAPRSYHFALHQNSPNPFAPATTIGYELGHRTSVSLRIYDVAGRFICAPANGEQDAGEHSAMWNGRNFEGRKVAPGVYIYILNTTEFHETRKMVLLH